MRAGSGSVKGFMPHKYDIDEALQTTLDYWNTLAEKEGGQPDPGWIGLCRMFLNHSDRLSCKECPVAEYHHLEYCAGMPKAIVGRVNELREIQLWFRQRNSIKYEDEKT